MAVHDEGRLILWDLDHTLLDGAGVSRVAYREAFARVTGQHLSELANMSGKTDLLIAAETLELHDVPAELEVLNAFLAAVAEELAARRELLATRGQALPGALTALKALSETPDVRQSVLTGNMRMLADLKVDVYGLADHLDLEAGAYGDDAAERNDLVPIAWERAERHYGRRFTGAETVIVGDTIRDVATAHANGTAIVCVATGSDSVEALTEAGADVVLADLTDTDAVVRAVLSAVPTGTGQ